MGILFKILFGFISIQVFFAKTVIWGIIAAFVAKKAKKYCISFATAFLLVFFLRFFGLIICIILMMKNEDTQNQQVASPHSERASSWDEPYTEAYTQQTNGGYHHTDFTEYTTKSYTCPSCSNVQEHKGFCMICGAQIK